MARIQSPTLLGGARSYSEQAVALRSLKDEMIGHVQHKEKWVEHGILVSLVRALQTSRSPTRLSGKEAGGSAGHSSLAEDDLVRLQSLQLLASIANGERATCTGNLRGV
jgi:armadillo repeat-containing protein 8